MAYILKAIADFKHLIWDGYTTFRHCSPLDPDFQTHFFFRWEMNYKKYEVSALMFKYNPPDGLLCMSIRDVLETCAR